MARSKQNLMTGKEYAKHLGVTPQYVSKLNAQGKTVRVGKLIDVRQSDAALKTYQRAGRVIMPERRADRAKKQPGKPKAQKAAARTSVPRAARAADPSTITHWNLEERKYKALKQKQDYEREQGSLLERDQVLHAERIKNERIRSMFRALPRSLAPVISRCASAAEAENLLREELDRVLQRLAEDPLGMKEAAALAAESEPEPAPLPLVQTPAPDQPEVHA